MVFLLNLSGFVRMGTTQTARGPNTEGVPDLRGQQTTRRYT